MNERKFFAMKLTTFHFLLLSLFIFCHQAKANVSIHSEEYGVLSNGDKVNLYTLKAGNITVKVINFGGIITEILVPDKQGKLGDVVLGFDNLADYETKNRYFGAIVGRFANRIRHGNISISGEKYQLSLNRPPHQIHGGHKGFDKVLWNAQIKKNDDSASLTLSYLSADGEEGYPGNLLVNVRYTVNQQNELVIDYKANTDKETVVNLTQHSYFNLAARRNTNVLQHDLAIYADSILPLAKDKFPTGAVMPVTHTPFDFRKAKSIGKDIKSEHEQLKIANGYDHYWLTGNPFDKKISSDHKSENAELNLVAMLSEPNSGRMMQVWSSEDGLQVYSANYLNKSIIGKYQQAYSPQYGICLETGQLPNSPADNKFPTYVLTPGSTYTSKTVYKFLN
ncbi:MAG: galactose mutarotase [Colwellia sp.]|nr:galactose mutarotase [Colwellia sp.]